MERPALLQLHRRIPLLPYGSSCPRRKDTSFQLGISGVDFEGKRSVLLSLSAPPCSQHPRNLWPSLSVFKGPLLFVAGHSPPPPGSAVLGSCSLGHAGGGHLGRSTEPGQVCVARRMHTPRTGASGKRRLALTSPRALVDRVREAPCLVLASGGEIGAVQCLLSPGNSNRQCWGG